MFEKVLHFDGHIISQMGMLFVKCSDQSDGMTDTVKEIGVTKREMLGASGDLLVDVFQYDFPLNNAKVSVVDWHDGAVTTKMLTPTGGFHVSNGQMPPLACDQMRVLCQVWQPHAIWHEEFLAGQGHDGFWLGACCGLSVI